MTKQNYYATHKRRQKQEIESDLVLTLARNVRKEHPRMGTKKVHRLIKPELDEAGAGIGRDRFISLMRENGELVKPKRKSMKTTNSRHSLPIFPNIIQFMETTGPNQAWVSDLTYIETREGWMYAALITDKHSRKIVGAHISDSLEAEGCVEALRKALKELPPGQFPVHHSDRGCQYCCHMYVDCLRRHGLGISMTEVMHCYENAMAERVNGILKQEYMLDEVFRTKEQAVKAFYEAVHLYNNRRPHMSLNYGFPAQVHAQAA